MSTPVPAAQKRGRPSSKQFLPLRSTRRVVQVQHVDAHDSEMASRNIFVPPLTEQGPSRVGIHYSEEDQRELNLSFFSDDDDEALPHENLTGFPLPKKRYTRADHPLAEWLPFRAEFLDEMIEWDGQGSDELKSCHCGRDRELHAPAFRCRDCQYATLMCRECCAQEHHQHPLHRVQMWNGSFFEPSSLRDVGVVVYLGHQGTPCPNAMAGPDNFTVLHVNGIHLVRTVFCGCSNAAPRRVQLIRCQWYPSTVSQPQTCATFNLMRHFHIQNLTSKQSAYHFYDGLERETDNTGYAVPKSRYIPFLRMLRQWRDLKMHKRAGRAHSNVDIKNSPSGSLAILCPACPQPAYNLPAGWQDVPESQRYIYQLTIAVDANFRLKNRSRAGLDIELAPGKSYFVDNTLYREHVMVPHKQDDISTCSGLAALSLADTKKDKGLRATGVGGSVCARHGCMRPCGLGDLQKGEKYRNMDYILFSSLQGTTLRCIVISYDIACQWVQNLWSQRHPLLPSRLQLSDEVNVETVIPKFHNAAHQKKCHTEYSFHYLTGSGQTDGESIERCWSGMNHVGNSTKEMTDASRHDTLNDHWGDANYRKVVDMASSLHRRLRKALPQCDLQADLFRDLSASITDETRTLYLRLVHEWEQDHSKVNPYEVFSTHKTLNEVRLAIITDEGFLNTRISLTPTMSKLKFLDEAMKIEKLQSRLAVDMEELGTSSTSKQKLDIQRRKVTLSEHLCSYFIAHAVHCPPVTGVSLPDSDAINTTPETVSLCLPSSLYTSPPTSPTPLVTMEASLRFAQGTDALASLRKMLCKKAQHVNFKHQNGVGQRHHTRIRGLIDACDFKVQAIASTYRRARETYFRLMPPTSESAVLRELRPQDVRSMGTSAERAMNGDLRHSESRYTTSWIWLDLEAGEGDISALGEVHRVEWVKSRARSLRWEEEVTLLKEELRRCSVFFESRALQWERDAVVRVGTSVSLANGLRAYACRQAHILRQRVSLSLELQSSIVYPLPVEQYPAALDNEEEDDFDGDPDEQEDLSDFD